MMKSGNINISINLYRMLLRQANKHEDYNIREYALRRIKDSFRENEKEKNLQRIQQLQSEGMSQLDLLTRQSAISQMYKHEKLVVENHSRPEEFLKLEEDQNSEIIAHNLVSEKSKIETESSLKEKVGQK